MSKQLSSRYSDKTSKYYKNIIEEGRDQRRAKCMAQIKRLRKQTKNLHNLIDFFD